jgi:beta-barrel assembly-enhancing protease
MARLRPSCLWESVMPKTLKNVGLFFAIASMLVIPALADRTVVRPGWNLFSTQQDIELGRILADDAERTLQLVTDHKANTYIDALGKQLSAHAPQARYSYQFKIVNDGALNAWALPGGLIYVTTGLIEAAQNEPQLAGAIAHEIAHVALRHGTSAVSQAYADQVANATRGRVAVNEAVSRLDIRFDQNAIPLKYSREEERQANVVATQIMYDTGFDAQQMTQFFQTVTKDRSNRTADFVDAHPLLTNQASIVRTEWRNIGPGPRTPRGDSGDFHSVKDRLLASNTNTNWPLSGHDRSGGNTPSLPSTRMVLYTGRDVEFRHPENWRVSEDGDSISVAPDAGLVSGSLAYGMTIATFEPQNSRFRNSFSTPQGRNDITLSSATDQLIDHMRQANPNMRVERNSERRRVDGAQAMVVELSNDSPLGGVETDWLVTVLRPNGMLRYFVGVAPQRDFSRYQATFDQIVSSVQFLD